MVYGTKGGPAAKTISIILGRAHAHTQINERERSEGNNKEVKVAVEEVLVANARRPSPPKPMSPSLSFLPI